MEPNKLKEIGLTPTSYYYLYSLYLSEEFPWGITTEFKSRIVEELIVGSWLSIEEELRPKSILLFEAKSVNESDEFEEFILTYHNLWPTQKESGINRILRSSDNDLKTKFIKWFKKYYKNEPDSIIYENIIKVTKKYLSEQRRERYKFCMKANHFVEKFGESTLYSYLQESDLEELDIDEENPFIIEV